MTPPARVQAAIELLDAIILAARDGGAAADAVTRRFFAERRYAGSKDRRAIRELAYQAIRRAGERPENGRSAMIGLSEDDPELASLFDGSQYGAAQISGDETGAPASLYPEWIAQRFAGLVDVAEQTALLDRAPLHIRARPGADVVSEWPDAQALPLDGAYEIPSGSNVEASSLHRDGQIEIQDLGSQAIVAALAGSAPKTILDLCAGNGGKTMALAESFPDASIVASDVGRPRLAELARRAGRAGYGNIYTRLLNPQKERETLAVEETFDLVLVDAPCSGTGTWRRNPELRWRATEKRLAATVALQRRLLELGAELTTPGGTLVYVVCSLLDEEGDNLIAALLDAQPDWEPHQPDLPIGRLYRKGMLLTPYHDGTDGFYFSILRKPC